MKSCWSAVGIDNKSLLNRYIWSKRRSLTSRLFNPKSLIVCIAFWRAGPRKALFGDKFSSQYIIIEIVRRVFRIIGCARVNIPCIRPFILFVYDVAHIATENPISPLINQLGKAAARTEVINRRLSPPGPTPCSALSLTVPADIVGPASQEWPDLPPVGIGRRPTNPILKMIDPALRELPGVPGNSVGFRTPVNPTQPRYPPSWVNSDCRESKKRSINSA